jgi:hypothetical protein
MNMNINWKEEDYSGDGKKPEFKKAGAKVDGKVDLTEALMGDTQTAYTTSSIKTPVYVGGYDITGGNGMQNSIVFNFVKKPNWFRRTCTKFFLGWTWIDKKEKENKGGLLLG